ncbi:hypothetical protein A3E39_02955 [Candidatus Uhrbacteria bacterium RIFCSPHIGHO2_12_FULL_60_25]|uniref:Uncharacterized protein n=1 Tax=Candidatus Uhrbacteria bacterium RIFCSPHIGHO2_12_FULL_60_25 TaxID=1802399 RepID=A0A1F7UIU5_9BACT|nr:MAG: hypothetical protein A3D73_00305 [Candidatus Uhrbacteria bacterium RIFCSPHIGHO2_02_FULL_60_44]OGL78191.1 MAG: hypothetical protein A3E39_02955 [Candidatus Uhrbacteria bacterium RIFCSPHIGHO2_12_FULL_60_25]
MRSLLLILVVEFMYLVLAFFRQETPEDVTDAGLHLHMVEFAQSRGDIVYVEPRMPWECSLTARFRTQYARSRLAPCIAERYVVDDSDLKDESTYFGDESVRYDTACALEILDLLKADGDIASIEPGYH